jgi:hypothetical protein
MRARHFYQTGLVLMTTLGLGHLGGFILAARAARHDPRLADVTSAMRSAKSSLLGLQPSILDFREYFSLSFSILIFLSAALGFALLGSNLDRATIVRTTAPWYATAMLLLLVASIFFSVPQGIISCAAIGMAFGLAWWCSRRERVPAAEPGG